MTPAQLAFWDVAGGPPTMPVRYYALNARAALLHADACAALAEASGLDPFSGEVEKAERVAVYRNCEESYRAQAARWAARAREAESDTKTD